MSRALPAQQRFLTVFARTALVAWSILATATAAAFSFSEEARKDAEAEEARKGASSHAIVLPQACLDDLRRKKIMILMGERSGDGVTAEQSRFSPHFNSINRRLLRHGIRTYSQQEIRAQIAQAEVDAYFVSLRPSLSQLPPRDLTMTKLRTLGSIVFADSDSFGV